MEFHFNGFTFFSDFDSGNLNKVEVVTKSERSKKKGTKKSVRRSLLDSGYDEEFNLWTRPDCYNTQYENNNRTWFHFGIKGGVCLSRLRMNIVNLNKQSRLFSHGMIPVCSHNNNLSLDKDKCHWERFNGPVTYKSEEGRMVLTMTWQCPTSDENQVTYFAFIYPYPYSLIQSTLYTMDVRYNNHPDIYYHRQLLCRSLEGHRVDLITITSYKGIADRNDKVCGIFPDPDDSRSHKFSEKKIVFISARVHPGETQSSFMFDGFMNFILRSKDPRAVLLRDKFVFKLIPCLNPDGVVNGHYRTDSRGLNLNRVYDNPCQLHHPTIYAVKKLIQYLHGRNPNPPVSLSNINNSLTDLNIESRTISSHFGGDSSSSNLVGSIKPSFLSPDSAFLTAKTCSCSANAQVKVSKESDISDSECCDRARQRSENQNSLSSLIEDSNDPDQLFIPQRNLRVLPPDLLHETRDGFELDDSFQETSVIPKAERNSPIFLSVDLHGHASKRGCFLYGNNFEGDDRVESMMLAKLMSINCVHFDFVACNFSERNMYTRDKSTDMSKAGSSRVALHKITSMLHSYTLESHYATGRCYNLIPPLPMCVNVQDTAQSPQNILPLLYTQETYREFGESLAVSILDLCDSNPISRLPNTEYSTVNGVRLWLKRYIQALELNPRPSFPKGTIPFSTSKHSRNRMKGTITPLLRTPPSSGHFRRSLGDIFVNLTDHQQVRRQTARRRIFSESDCTSKRLYPKLPVTHISLANKNPTLIRSQSAVPTSTIPNTPKLPHKSDNEQKPEKTLTKKIKTPKLKSTSSTEEKGKTRESKPAKAKHHKVITTVVPLEGSVSSGLKRTKKRIAMVKKRRLVSSKSPPEEKENTTDVAKWSVTSKGETVKSDDVVKLGPVLSTKEVLKDAGSHKDVLGSPLQCTISPHNSPLWNAEFPDSTPGTSVAILSNAGLGNIQTLFKKKKKSVKVSMQKDSKVAPTKMKCRKKLKSLKRQTTM